MTTTPSRGTPRQNFQQRARADSKKLDMVLKTLEDVKWSPSRFLLELLRLEKIGREGVAVTVTRTDKHKRVVKQCLMGQQSRLLVKFLSCYGETRTEPNFERTTSLFHQSTRCSLAMLLLTSLSMQDH